MRTTLVARFSIRVFAFIVSIRNTIKVVIGHSVCCKITGLVLQTVFLVQDSIIVGIVGTADLIHDASDAGCLSAFTNPMIK